MVKLSIAYLIFGLQEVIFIGSQKDALLTFIHDSNAESNEVLHIKNMVKIIFSNVT